MQLPGVALIAEPFAMTQFFDNIVIILDMMHAGASYPMLQGAVPIHPTVSELIPTVPGDLKPVP